MARQCLEAFLCVYTRPRIQKGRKVMTEGGIVRQDNIVFTGAADLMEPKLRESPLVAVFTFGIAGRFTGMAAVVFFPFVGGVVPSVVPAIEIAVFDNRRVVPYQRRFCQGEFLGRVQPERYILHVVDEQFVDKQLEPCADSHGLLGRGAICPCKSAGQYQIAEND